MQLLLTLRHFRLRMEPIAGETVVIPLQATLRDSSSGRRATSEGGRDQTQSMIGSFPGLLLVFITAFFPSTTGEIKTKVRPENEVKSMVQ